MKSYADEKWSKKDASSATYRSLGALRGKWKKVSWKRSTQKAATSLADEFMAHSPSIITSHAPDTNRVDRLCIQNSQIFRIDKLQSTFVQIQEQVFALQVNLWHDFILNSKDCSRLNLHHPTAQCCRANHSCQTTSRGCTYLQLLTSARAWDLPRQSPPIPRIALQIWWAFRSPISTDSCVVCEKRWEKV